ncbi:hypothetical protein [Maribacter litoralis]|uniref:O-antigen ligase like membrane protein n=1 Tax=Maribacter litoralis TaxID=2059726 RepID=A0A653SMP0_9FLAO|nr:hypothetical protein [Maribacter litoralis]VXB65704.1 conserved membrane hypothetical protein [Maribacter litoralis]
MTDSVYTNSRQSAEKLIKIGIWTYLFLLLFEGALRKWFLPFLSGPLALIRDPLALLIILIALKNGLLRLNIYILSTVFITIIAFGTTFLVGHGNIGVSVYGVRILLIQFPLIFVIGNIFNKVDVLKVGKILIWISLPMTILMILQFYSPQSAWVNRGLGGDLEGAGFSGALGFFRPPGTFSFISGLTQFYGVVACFIMYFWFKQQNINRLLLILATLGLLAAIPFSISRTLLYQTIITVFFMLIAAFHKSKYIPKIIFGFAGFVTLFIILINTGFLAKPMEVFISRFEGATEYEGGVSGTIVDRYLGGMVNAVTSTAENPFFGHGIGIGTNAGGKLLTGDKVMLIYAEDEWARLIGESGLLLGLIMIFIRIILSFQLTLTSYKMLRMGNMLPWLLLSFCLTLIPNGQWGQITTLGFATFSTGILIASFKK